jgi:hypothetical protein
MSSTTTNKRKKKNFKIFVENEMKHFIHVRF